MVIIESLPLEEEAIVENLSPEQLSMTIGNYKKKKKTAEWSGTGSREAPHS